LTEGAAIAIVFIVAGHSSLGGFIEQTVPALANALSIADALSNEGIVVAVAVITRALPRKQTWLPCVPRY